MEAGNKLCSEKVKALRLSLQEVQATDFGVLTIILPREYEKQRQNQALQVLDDAFDDALDAYIQCVQLPADDGLPPPDVITRDCRHVIEEIYRVDPGDVLLREVPDIADLLKRPRGLIDRFIEVCQIQEPGN